ncbi:MAG: hypothetical protein M1546_21250 [Chloroflexi bacterium]|nr:hypothetical protein [Chloroflexota bacterium]
MATHQRVGEPYHLAGKRMAFLDYRYILVPGLGWFDDCGNAVAVVGDQGPWDAHFRLNERSYGIRIIAQPAERAVQPLTIPPERPWEAGGMNLGHLLYDADDGCYKAWAECAVEGRKLLCYLQSEDLAHWVRPDLGLVEFNGNRHNNLIDSGGLSSALLHGAIFKDPSSQDERWKWIGEGSVTREQFEAYQRRRPGEWDPKSERVDVPAPAGPGNLIVAVKGAVSPDGLRWTAIDAPLVVEHSDTIVTAYYDRSLRKYVGYFRDWMTGERSPRASGDNGLGWMMGRRSIGRAETEDFRNFPLSEVILEPGPDILGPCDTLYTNGHGFIPGAPDQHVFFPTIWHQDNDTTSVAILSSSDGKRLHWLPGNPVLDTAPFERWDGGCIFAKDNLLELPNGDWGLPYAGYNFPHKYPRQGPLKVGMGLMTWRHGRLVAVEAQELGQFTTYAIIPAGRRLRINALSLRTGSVLVELADLNRKTIPGRSFADCVPIIGDQFRAPVTWAGVDGSVDDLGVAEGTPVCLRFRLDQAKLFSVDFEN